MTNQTVSNSVSVPRTLTVLSLFDADGNRTESYADKCVVFGKKTDSDLAIEASNWFYALKWNAHHHRYTDDMGNPCIIYVETYKRCSDGDTALSELDFAENDNVRYLRDRRDFDKECYKLVSEYSLGAVRCKHI